MRIRRTYYAWQNMHRRCKKAKGVDIANYEKRGITICEEWDTYKEFLKDMGECPEGLSLDRINNDGPYCKSNCRWATRSDQTLNQRTRKDNKSGRRGVHFYKATNTWRAQGSIEGLKELLYSGPSFEEACKARAVWEVKYGIPYYE